MPDGQPQPPLTGELTEYLDGLARLGGAASAIEVLVADTEAIRYRHAAGFRVGGERLQPGARFDAASLTKPWMATLALCLDRSQKVRLDTRLGALFPAAGPWNWTRTLEDLLRHRAGIAAWAPLFARLGKRLTDAEELADFLLSESWWKESGPESADLATYSDLGYLLWGLAAEAVTGQSLADLLDLHVTGPLGLAPLGALAANPPIESIVECRLDNWKEVELAAEQGVKLTRQAPFLRGVPQDGNARAIGRLTAHAGLFVTADELLALGREWLAPGRLLDGAEVARSLAGGGAFALGWARQTSDGSSGPDLASDAFGHAGFTGGTLWIEPSRGRLVVVLAHRLSSRIDMNPIRREIHRLAAEIGRS